MGWHLNNIFVMKRNTFSVRLQQDKFVKLWEFCILQLYVHLFSVNCEQIIIKVHLKVLVLLTEFSFFTY